MTRDNPPAVRNDSLVAIRRERILIAIGVMNATIAPRCITPEAGHIKSAPKASTLAIFRMQGNHKRKLLRPANRVFKRALEVRRAFACRRLKAVKRNPFGDEAAKPGAEKDHPGDSKA